jgi:hypothetical protein
MTKKTPAPDDLFDSVIENEGEPEKLVDDQHNHHRHHNNNIGQDDPAYGNGIPLMPRSNKPSSSRTLASGGVTVKTDIVVKVDEESHISPSEAPSSFGLGDGERIEQHTSAFAAWPQTGRFDSNV